MNCRQVQRKLQLMLDGRLGAAAVKEVEGHLAACHDCRSECEVLRAVDRALAGETPVDPPEGMAAIIARRAAARLAMRRRVLIPRWLEGLTITGIGTATAIAGFAGCRVLVGTSNGSLLSGGMLGVMGLFLGAALVVFGALYYRA